MKIGLFVPCYVDQFYPQVGMATVELLRQHDLEFEFPTTQTCCGQPMANTGCNRDAIPLAQRFVEIFLPYDYIVCPSGSCVAMVRHHFDELLEGNAQLDEVKSRTFELCEFLTDVVKSDRIQGEFAHRVGVHQSCHGLRELRLGSSSELMSPAFSKVHSLLDRLDGIELVELERPDECCGFGGTFAVNEEAVSCMMGLDRIADHERSGTEVLTAGDMSCLMHLEGLIRRQKKDIRVMHVAEILAEAMTPAHSD